MSIVKVTLPGGQIPVTGKQVSFVAPCDCTNVEGLSIEGEVYTVVDAMGQCVTGKGGAFCAGSVVSVILNVEDKKAFIQNYSSYNKRETLTPETAALLGLSEDAVPDDAFAKFCAHNWLRMKKNYALANGTSTTTVCTSVYQNQSEKKAVYYSASVGINANGVPVLTGTVSTLNVSYDTYTTAQTLRGKYWTTSSDYTSPKYSGSNANVSRETYDGGDSYMYLFYRVTISAAPVSVVITYVEPEYISDNARNTYPDNGEVDGYLYTYKGTIYSNAISGAKIETGTYKGTGGYGANTPCSLTFGITPKFVLLGTSIARTSFSTSNNAFVILPWGGTVFSTGSGSSTQNTVSYSGNTMSWYNANNAANQLNTSGTTYPYVVIG